MHHSYPQMKGTFQYVLVYIPAHRLGFHQPRTVSASMSTVPIPEFVWENLDVDLEWFGRGGAHPP